MSTARPTPRREPARRPPRAGRRAPSSRAGGARGVGLFAAVLVMSVCASAITVVAVPEQTLASVDEGVPLA